MIGCAYCVGGGGGPTPAEQQAQPSYMYERHILGLWMGETITSLQKSRTGESREGQEKDTVMVVWRRQFENK